VPWLVLEGTFILRGRRGKGYVEKSDFLYRPAKDCISMQRASLPYQTMFYGVISDDQSHLENARAIVAGECCKLSRGGTSTIGREDICMSYWEVQKPLRVVSLINDATFPDVKDNVLLNVMRQKFIEFHGDQQTSSEEREIARFINSEFTKVVKNDREYLITATLSHDIITDWECDGIVYPSVQMGGQAGINIALTPSAVDNKLKFVRSLEQTLYKNRDNSFLRIEKANGIELIPKNYSDDIIVKGLGIESLSDLPLID
jgi:hypothetical protein